MGVVGGFRGIVLEGMRQGKVGGVGGVGAKGKVGRAWEEDMRQGGGGGG